MRQQLFIIGLALVVVACTTNSGKQLVTKVEDYDKYLNTSYNASYQQAVSSKEFWSKRLRPDSSGVGDLSPLAGAYSQLFTTTGNPAFLKYAERLYEKGIQLSAQGKDAFARGLARNYISQHRFKDAYQLLLKTHDGPSNKHETELVLFDVAMEIGNYEAAYQYLESLKNLNDYHYLIRLSKWNDHRGDQDSAIKYLENARDIAESRDSKPLKVWTYSNLADYYGHAGRIAESYQHFLQTLELQPDNYYAKKGIAWILYSEEHNTREAHRILDSIMKDHQLPDYHLLKAEMYEFEGYNAKAEQAKREFVASQASGAYGDMYNTYLIEYYTEEDPQKALTLATSELENRATPGIYHLLALAQLKNEMKLEALKTIETFVEGKTSEPMALFHSALVYKANNKTEKVTRLKTELIGASYELGPLLTKEIEAL